MHLTRFEPWSIVDLLHRDLDRIARSRFNGSDDESAVTNWVPAVDIIEEENRFVLHADVPGVDPKDIEVSMDAGVLSVSGERQSENVTSESGFRRVERAHGRFFRRFNLPDTADGEGITARSSNGILEVSIPKRPELQARRITVEAA